MFSKISQTNDEEITSPFFGQSEFEQQIIDHIHYTGWKDDTATDEEWLHQDIDTLIEYMEKARKVKERLNSP